MTAVDRQPNHPNLIRGISPDPAVAELQKSHLRPGGRETHGAYGGPELARLRREHSDALVRDFPSFDTRRRALLADRLARCQLAMSWADTHGITPKGTTKLGAVHPIIVALDRWSSQADALIAQAEAVEAAAAAPHASKLEQIVAEIEAGEDSQPPAAEGDGDE